MKRLFVTAAAAAFVCLTGCQSTGIVHKEYSPAGELTKKVAIYRGSVATITETSGLKIDYQGVKAELDIYSNKGDAEMIAQVSSMVIGGLLAYGSGGTTAVPAGVAAALSQYRKKAAASTNAAPADCGTPGGPDCAPQETPAAAPQAPRRERPDKVCPEGTGAACEPAKPPAGAVDPLCYPQTPFVKQTEPAK